MTVPPINALEMLRPKRKSTGSSAIRLPFLENGEVDWPSFRGHVERTAKAGLTPAVNMDTGYVHLLSDDIRRQVLAATRETLGGPSSANSLTNPSASLAAASSAAVKTQSHIENLQSPDFRR